MDKLRLVFAGTPAFAAAHLSALLEDASFDVVAVYTQPDRPSGRGKKLQPSPVKQVADQHGVPVYQPTSLKTAEQKELLADLDADILVVVAYGLILPQPILDTPRFGCINVHASLLPRWRGAAPIERALLAGDKVTGVTIMQMDAGLDTGDMLYVEEVPIIPQDTRLDLEQKLCDAGKSALLHTLRNYEALANKAQKQDDSLSTYADKMDKREALVDWHQSALLIDRQIRAGIGRVPAFTFLEGNRMRILAAAPDTGSYDKACGTIVAADKNSITVACEQSSLILYTLQLPGKNPMGVHDIHNSKPSLFKLGKVFSNTESNS